MIYIFKLNILMIYIHNTNLLLFVKSFALYVFETNNLIKDKKENYKFMFTINTFNSIDASI